MCLIQLRVYDIYVYYIYYITVAVVVSISCYYVKNGSTE